MWGGTRTSYHYLALDFELGIVTRILEEEVDVADHGERFDIFVCELGLILDRLQRTREDDKCKFWQCETKYYSNKWCDGEKLLNCARTVLVFLPTSC